MKRIVLRSLWVVECAFAFLNLIASGQIINNGGNTQPPKCLTEAKIQLTANPPVVSYGQPSTVSWSVNMPAGCSPQIQFNGTTVAKQGSQSVTPPSNSTYTLILSMTQLGVFGERNTSVQVQVLYPPVVVIDTTTPNPVQVLVGALSSGNPTQTVQFCGDLDLTGLTGITIGDYESLMASPSCARSARALGPRIFVTDRRGDAPLFVITGDHVVVSGFRLQGPTNGIGEGDIDEKGIVISPAASAAPIHSVEICNMEIFYWSGEGLQVTDNTALAQRGRLFNTNVGAVHIHGNYFHDNQHEDKDGYGVEVAAGAYALIEQNVFDQNRHDIAGGSKNANGLDYSGYTVRDNLILSGGGKDCSASDWRILCAWLCGCWQTHQIDMHGDGNAWYSSNNWECGIAGETLIIQRNTILYTSGPAIKIRGNPADKAVVDGNVFKAKISDSPITQNGACGGWGDNITNPIQILPNNVFGADPMAQLGSCDFFGDGQEDQFMATGVTWWALSPVTHEWRYLNTMSEQLPQLQLRKIDADAVCDVAPRTKIPAIPPSEYSKSGTSPWEPLYVLHQ
jgi:hypothetical protein